MAGAPSPALWARTSAAAASLRPALRRRQLPVLARHRLLASMAGDSVELQVQLLQHAGPFGDHEHPVPAPVPAPVPTLLGRLQAAIAAADPAGPGPAAASHPTDVADGSVQVHACHGRARQVEVLRDVLVGLFADDPTLQPRDVVVMCPDVEEFAPLVTAAFVPVPGSAAHHPGRDLRVQVADRSLRRTNPCLDLLARLLDLADSRVSAPDVLDLLAQAPVRQRFGLDAEDLERVRGWAVEAGARWGEDAARRARFGLGHVRQGTWDAAVDRLLLGVAMAEEDHRFVGSALPLDDVPASDVDLAGRLAEFLERLTTVLAGLDGLAPLQAWLQTLDDALTLLADVPAPDAWQLVQARAVLHDVRSAAGEDSQATDTGLTLPEVRALLAERLRGRPTRAGFRTGALTVCSLEPMRAVPHRVVCLLGMDDGAFPRTVVDDGDDLLRRDPCPGERDPRLQDRQLFLDAVTSAQEVLVVVHSGADERTGAARPPAVPVAELLDALDTLHPGAGSAVVVPHPLQPTDPRTFVPGALGRPGPFGFDPAAHAAARAGLTDRTPPPPVLGRHLPVERADTVALDDLVACLEHPARWFLRTRVHVPVADDRHDDVQDRLELEVDGLTRWEVGDRLLAARLAGDDLAVARQAEWRRGQLPPRWLGHAVLERVCAQVEPIAEAVRPWQGAAALTLDVVADLPQGIPVVGTVTGVRELAEPTLVRAVFSRLAGKHRLRAWVQLLALAVARPDRPWQAVVVGRAPGRRDLAAVSVLTAPPSAQAAQRLQDLLVLRDHAQRAPLPLPVAAASAYAAARSGGTPEPAALEDASRAWQEAREDADPAWQLCLAPDVRFSALLEPPGRAEAAWAARWGETTRFGVLARRVWEPLLAAERRWTA
ncbi:MAG: exodeoxyribonuclease V subunit gamma [Kineosporiaceae bacterium]